MATGSEQSSGPAQQHAGRPPVIHEGLPTQLPDIDPDETKEWLDSFDAMVDERGRSRARYMQLLVGAFGDSSDKRRVKSA